MHTYSEENIRLASYCPFNKLQKSSTGNLKELKCYEIFFSQKYLTFLFCLFMNPTLTKEKIMAKDRMNIIFQYANIIVKATGIRVNFLWKTNKKERMKLPGLIMP